VTTQPPTFTQPQLVQNWINAYAAETGVTPNLQPGNIALAYAYADAGQAESLQYMAQVVINFARASTSTGADLDSWMADFGFPRLPAGYAGGTVTFSTPVPLTVNALVPVGAVISTPGGAISYQVIADTTQAAYSVSLNAYVLIAGDTSMNATAQALVAGASYNVQAGQLTQIQATIYGIAAVTNASAIQNGSAAESDTSFRARFVLYINSLSKGTQQAIQAAIEATGGVGLKVALFENVQAVGNPPTSFNSPYPGNFVALIDNGTGSPPSGLLSTIYTALFANVRAFTISYQILPPYVSHPSIVTTIRVNPDSTEATGTVQANVQAALVAYINALPIGGTLWISDLIDTIINADPNVEAIEDGSTKINDSTSSLVQQEWQEVFVSNSNVVVSTF
jgi:uncharacterized phage protein gp47/JayE